MTLIFKRFIRLAPLWLLLLLMVGFGCRAEPYLAIKNNLKCASCHVNPNGGGMRNDFGRIYGQTVLPAINSTIDSNALAKIAKYLAIGGNARFDATYQKDQNDSASQSFALANAQLYLNIAIPETGLSFYLDQQVAPGSAINREAFVRYQFEQGHYIKAGKLFLPFGLRIEDDSAFIRQATGMNFDNSDNGVEFTLEYSRTTVNFYLSNGTSQASNDDDRFLYGARVEQLFSNYRLGGGALINDGEQQTRMLNLYGGAQWGNFTFLAEVDWLNLEAANTFNNRDIEQLVSLFEVNYQWSQGWNLKLSAEYLDPDRAVAQDQQTRYSLIGEYTPLSGLITKAVKNGHSGSLYH